MKTACRVVFLSARFHVGTGGRGLLLSRHPTVEEFRSVWFAGFGYRAARAARAARAYLGLSHHGPDFTVHRSGAELPRGPRLCVLPPWRIDGESSVEDRWRSGGDGNGCWDVLGLDVRQVGSKHVGLASEG